MMTLQTLGGLGGIVAFLIAIFTVLRGIFGQVNATKDNTAAIEKLTTVVEKLDEKYGDKYDTLSVKVARLEGQRR